MKLIFQAVILTISFTILACNQSPTNTKSDPLRNYNGLKGDVSPGKAGKDTNEPAKVDDGQPFACEKAYTMVITDQDGKDTGSTLDFNVGESKIYHIALSADLQMAAVPTLPGMVLNRVEAGMWDLTFKPRADQTNTTMGLVVDVPQTGCHTDGNAPETLAINVNSSGKPRPRIAIVDLDQERPYQSTDTITFHVDVRDPNLANSETPVLPEFRFEDGFHTHEPAYVSAQNAVSCSSPAAAVSKKIYRFTCRVDVNQIKPNFTKPIQTGFSSFFIFERSVSGDVSIAQPIHLTVLYPSFTGESAQAAEPVPTKPEKKSTKASPKKKSGDNT